MEAIKFLKEFYTILFVWLSAIAAVQCFRTSLPFTHKIFVALVVVLGVTETIANVLAFNGIKNHFLFNVMYGLRAIVIPFLYKDWLEDPRIRKIIMIFLIAFLLFIIAETFWIHGFFTLHTYSFVIGGTVILLLSIAYLWQLYTNEESQIIIRDPVFWFSLAFLIYFAVSLPYIGMFNYLWSHFPAFTRLYYELIFDGTICLHNILLTIGLLCLRPATR